MKSCAMCVVGILIIMHQTLTAQDIIPYFGTPPTISGYERDIQGETLTYYSLYHKYVKQALLTRCTDGKKIIEWETDIIPGNVTGKYAYFTWVTGHSSGTSSGERKFDLYINDAPVLTFSTQPKSYPPYWSFGAPDSTRIVFVYKKQDAAKDSHGMSYLRVPISKYKKGQALKLKIVGHNQNSNDWYMVFKYSFKEKIDFLPMPFIMKSSNEQPIQITMLHFGENKTLTVSINKTKTQNFQVVNGFNTFEISVPVVTSPTTFSVEASIPKTLQVSKEVIVKPVTYREVNLVHHSHTDIGYSHHQEQVIQIHTENIRQALMLIEKTRSYPDNSRFIWNIESSWAVENFLRGATNAEAKQFFTAVKDGSIVISATFANILTGLCTPEEMNWITEYSRRLRDSLALPIRTAMMSDIPGLSWSMVSALAKNGVRYFSNGPNFVQNLPEKGDRIGYTLLEQGNKAFWWRSTSGRDSILMWTCGKGYSSWHGYNEGDIYERGPEHIGNYLYELDSIHYPYDMIQWRYNISADNGPVDKRISDFVKSWNEKYSSPKLVLANVTDMFERFEKKYGKVIPSLSGDFTPYWEDGAYSTTREESENRMLSEKLQLLLDIATQKKIPVNAAWSYQAKRNIVLFHEHTWGSWNSISDPDVNFTTSQWDYKKSFLDSAQYYVARIEEVLKKNIAKPNEINVVNTLSWVRSGVVEIDASSFKGNVLVDPNGKHVPFQLKGTDKLCFIAENVPAQGSKVYKIESTKKANKKTPQFESSITFAADSLTGSIKSLVTAGNEWVNPKDYKGLMQVLYVAGLNPAQFNLTQTREIKLVNNGPVLKTMRVISTGEGFNEVTYEINQYSKQNYIQLSVTLDKKPVREKESVHLAFPFMLTSPDVHVGIDNSFITIPQGQIPGANKDFYSVQRWLDISNADRGVTVTSPQLALYEVGEMINEERVNNGYKRWKTNITPSSNIFLYAMNNYWHTNYKADQDGKVKLDVYLHFHNAFDPVKANQFGYEITQPLIGF